MVGSVREQTSHRRKHRVYGSPESEEVRLSGLSLSSNTTGTSNASTESTSTVTQDLYSRARQMGEGRRKSRRRSESERQAEILSLDNNINHKDINVFEFLVEETVKEVVVEDEPAAEAVDDPVDDALGGVVDDVVTDMVAKPEMEMTNVTSALVLRQDSPIQGEDSEVEGYYRSQLSDSGISMGSSVGEAHHDTFTKHALSPLIEEAREYPGHTPSIADTYYQHDYPVWNPYVPALYTPEPMPLSPVSMPIHPYPQDYRYQSTPEPPSTGTSVTSCLDFAPLTFRHKEERDPSPPPVLRSFAKVNARMLMQMQSNIADLEHELSCLDSKIAQAQRSVKSRRVESRSLAKHLSKHRAQRAELYQELNTSLFDYYDAVETYHKFTQITSPAKPGDILALKTWLRSNIIPSSKMEPLVAGESDLVRLGHHQGEVSKETLQLIFYCIFTDLLFPLILFKLTNSALSRLILLSTIAIVAALVLDRHRTVLGLELGQTFGFCTIACLSISLLAALLF